MSRSLPRSFYLRPLLTVARELLGKRLERDGVGGTIVEVEGYHQDEAASHAFRGKTRRNASLFLRGGHVYVYRIHQAICANLVVGQEGAGCAVLIRALLPERGRELIEARRGRRPEPDWCDGPGKLAQALAITLADDGLDLEAKRAPIRVLDQGREYSEAEITSGPRVGISKATELPWRYRVTSLTKARGL